MPAIAEQDRSIDQAIERVEIQAQPGPQVNFLSTPADIAIFGGAAGGGKSFALLMEAARNVHNPKYGGVIFRRTYPEIKDEGGLWDTSLEIYPFLNAISKEGSLQHVFPSGAKVRFLHMQHEKDLHKRQGTQIPFIGWDELTHFTKKMFFYMLSRNRSVSGIRPYVRATTNPDPDSFVRTLLDWWIDNDTGLAIPERSGVIRWMMHANDDMYWADTWRELSKQFNCKHAEEILAPYMDRMTSNEVLFALCPRCGQEIIKPKSFTFIASYVQDNKILLAKNPDYISSLQLLQKVDRERLLRGNWNIRLSAGMFFQKGWFPIVEAVPKLVKTVRYWDFAATGEEEGGDPSWTVGLKIGIDAWNQYYILDLVRFRGSSNTVEQTVKNIASQDGRTCWIGIEQDPGQAGKAQAAHYSRLLNQYYVKINNVRESKGQRAMAPSAQAEQGNIKIVRGKWNEGFLAEAENFDGTDKGHADRIDALSGGYFVLTVDKSAGVWGKR